MAILIQILLAVNLLIAILIILVTLMQRPKQEGLGAAFGGGMTENLFGAQTTNVLVTITRWLGGLFLVICLAVSALYARQDTRGSAVQKELLSSPAVTPDATKEAEEGATPAASPEAAAPEATPAAPATEEAPATTAPQEEAAPATPEAAPEVTPAATATPEEGPAVPEATPASTPEAAAPEAQAPAAEAETHFTLGASEGEAFSVGETPAEEIGNAPVATP